MRVPYALAIDGMHCAACVRRVKAAVGALPGVSIDELKVGAMHGSLDGVELATVIAAIERAGFTVPPRE